MDESVFVQVRQRRREREADLDAVGNRKANVLFEIVTESVRLIRGR
jgi:hypothetical protein